MNYYAGRVRYSQRPRLSRLYLSRDEDGSECLREPRLLENLNRCGHIADAGFFQQVQDHAG